jgi:hypothetical protein
MVKKVVQKADIAEDQTEESLGVAQKKENFKKIQKQQKLMKTLVKQKIDIKQVAKAVAALKKYSKAKRSLASKAKDLLTNEDEPIHISFTLT